MPYVVQEDVIAFVEQEINFTKGNSQQYQIILYRDFIGNQLNAREATAVYVSIMDANGKKLLQYSEPVTYGVSDILNLGTGETKGHLTFEITAFQSSFVTTGQLFAEVSVLYDNYYPQAKKYVLPLIALGYAIANPGDGNGGGGGDNGGGNSGNTNVPQPNFTIEYVDGSNPTVPGSVSFDASDPVEVTSILFRNLDKNRVRLTVLENFLINRIVNSGADGTITIVNQEDPTQYSIYKILDWSRVDITTGNGNADDSDGILINVLLEASSSGPGVSSITWLVGQTISFSLDSYGSSTSNINTSEGVLTYTDKNLNPSNTSGNTSPTGVYITYTPYQDSYVQVEVNGISVEVGDGVKSASAYFSGNNGLTASRIFEIRTGDQLIWNGLIAGYELEAGDQINFIYEASIDDVI